MLAESIELIRECCLELFPGDVGQLGFSHKRLGLGTDQFLFEHDDTGTVWFLVLELRNLIGNLLLAWARKPSVFGRVWEVVKDQLTVSARLHRSFNVADALNSNTILVVAVDELILEFTDLVSENTELISYIRDILIASFTPK